ncbi:hypothetical protein [Clostridium sp. HBUAS56017]|uniref:hypothetical protein n=1 Tax=Clostridium sp. HBUAS56017 TaxID=2571128 RepID=UPI00117855DC|nr:hypothetical protein [Clostridium sp. HBUAS56017]
MIIKCDKCKKTFDFNNESIKEKYLGAMITEWYFICPHCGHKYLVSLFDTKSRVMLRQVEEFRNKGMLIKSDKLLMERKDHIQKLNHG